MEARLIVPDASVLLKWVLRSPDEQDTAQALALKSAWIAGEVDVVVPTLWAFEVGNVLGLKQSSTAGLLLGALVDLELPEVSARRYVEPIFRLMRRFHVTFYDAAYHALAIDRGGVMLTADRRYVRTCRAAGGVADLALWQAPAPRAPVEDEDPR